PAHRRAQAGAPSPGPAAAAGGVAMLKAVRSLLAMLALAASVMLSASAAHAVQPDEVLPDPALERRARALSQNLRCMVCQNQSIDDSDAPLARDLRLLVRERLKAGDSDGQVIDFLVGRYGEFVLLKPRFGWHTAILWAAPAGVLVIGALVVFFGFRNRPATVETADLAPEEKRRLDDMLR